MVKALLGGNAETEKSTQEGATPLHMASLQGHVDVVQSLLQVGEKTQEKHGQNQKGKVQKGKLQMNK